MSYSPVLNDILEVTTAATINDQVSLNKVHYQVVAASGTAVTQLVIATYIDAAIVTAYKALLTSAATYRGTGVQKIWPIPKPVQEAAVANAGVGTGGATPLATGTCGLISTVSALAGRAFRGRLYVAFPATSAITTSGHPVTGYVTGLGTLATAWLSSLVITSGGSTVTLSPVIWHRKANKAGTALPNTGTPITGWTARTIWASNRRRADYGRANLLPF